MKHLLLLLVVILSACNGNQSLSTSTLGSHEFTPESWSTASQEERGEMVHSFLTKYKVDGMDVKELYKLLGESTAYYEYDEFPAYFVGPKSIESIYGKGYVLAFPLDRSTGKIRKYVIEPEIKRN